MKKYFSITLLCILSLLGAVENSPGAAWDVANQFGNPGNDSAFSGKGALLSVVQSVQSNSVYYITGANVSGTPRVLNVLGKTELTAGTFQFYVATNSYTLASNQVVGTNILWLTSTNAGMATNDILVYQNKANGQDSYQMTIVSGNATDGTGLVFTNALGQCAIKIFNTLTNQPAAGDTLWTMRSVFSSTPLQEGLITNSILAPWSTWLPIVNDLGPGITANGGGYGIMFSGRIGTPTLSVLTFSNAGSLFVSGDYYRHVR